MLKRLIKESFELWCKKRWLKLTDKEFNKSNKHYKKYKRHDYIARELMKEYEILYGDKEHLREKASDTE